MREEILPLAETPQEAGMGCPALVARLGTDTYAFVERWLADVEDELNS